MQHQRNELKHKILSYLHRQRNPKTSAQISKAIGVRTENVRYTLSHYHATRAGLFQRTAPVRGREYGYVISRKGRQELYKGR